MARGMEAVKELGCPGGFANPLQPLPVRGGTPLPQAGAPRAKGVCCPALCKQGRCLYVGPASLGVGRKGGERRVRRPAQSACVAGMGHWRVRRCRCARPGAARPAAQPPLYFRVLGFMVVAAIPREIAHSNMVVPTRTTMAQQLLPRQGRHGSAAVRRSLPCRHPSQAVHSRVGHQVHHEILWVFPSAPRHSGGLGA